MDIFNGSPQRYVSRLLPQLTFSRHMDIFKGLLDICNDPPTWICFKAPSPMNIFQGTWISLKAPPRRYFLESPTWISLKAPPRRYFLGSPTWMKSGRRREAQFPESDRESTDRNLHHHPQFIIIIVIIIIFIKTMLNSLSSLSKHCPIWPFSLFDTLSTKRFKNATCDN